MKKPVFGVCDQVKTQNWLSQLQRQATVMKFGI